jgi:hypothetical protein
MFYIISLVKLIKKFKILVSKGTYIHGIKVLRKGCCCRYNRPKLPFFYALLEETQRKKTQRNASHRW